MSAANHPGKAVRAFLASCLLAAVVASMPGARAEAPPAAEPRVEASSPVPDSGHLEKELQSLNWQQFKTVVKAVPKLKADVDAYGPLGWQYVQENYRTYGWRKNIDKLKDDQKRQLAELIADARSGRKAAR